MDFRYYHGSHVGVDKVSGDLELLTENVELSVAPDEPDQRDVAIRNMFELRQPCVWPEGYGTKLFSYNEFERRLPLQAAIAMMPVVKRLEVLALPLEHGIT